MTKETKMPNFPKTIYVTEDGDDDDKWLNAARESDEFEDGQKVAIYQLVEVKTAKITRVLE
jgi:hypothetical protein